MPRSATRIGSELVPVVLVLASLAGTWGLVVAMYRRQPAQRKPPSVVALPAPPAPKQPPAAPKRVLPPAPAPKPLEDPTPKALAAIAEQEAEQRREASAADRRAEALETARREALGRAESFRRREMLVKAQIASLEKSARELEDEADALDMERDVLARETDALKSDMMKARSGGGAAVLPYRGPNGTWRVPITLECRNGSVTLQPGGPTISLLELSPVLTMRNSPLVIGVARQMMKLQSVATPDGSSAVPYILFVVRPDGIRPYYEARARLEMLGLSFGYELVAQDEQIEFPDLTDASEWTESPSSRHLAVNPEDVWPAKARTTPDGPAGRGDAGDYVWKAKPGDAGTESSSGGGAIEAEAGAEAPGIDRSDGVVRTPPSPPGRSPGLPGTRPGARYGPGRTPIAAGDLIDPLSPERGSNHIGSGGAGALEEPGPFPLPVPHGGGGGTSAATPGGGAGGSAPLVVEEMAPGNAAAPNSEDGMAPPRRTSQAGLNPTSDLADGTARGGTGATDAQHQRPGGTTNLADLPAYPQGDPTLRGGGTPSRGTSADTGSPHLGRGIGGRPDLTSRFAPNANTTPSSNDTLGDWPSGNVSRQVGGRNGSNTGAGGSRSSLTAVARGTVIGRSDGSGTTPDPGMIGIGNMSGSNTEGSGTDSKTKGTNGDSSSSGMPSVGLPGQAQGQGAGARNFDARVTYRKQRNLEVVVTCDTKGVHIQPGGYRLSLSHLDPKEGRFLETLRGAVAAREATDRSVDWKPRIKFLVEPGGEDVYWKARRQTILAGLGWPIELQVAERDPIRLLSTEGLR